jgi:Protein of unknown function (DUF2637)
VRLNGTVVTANVVAGAAFLASAQHIYSVAYEAGNPWPIAAVHAIGIDGLILIGINTLKDSRAAGVTAIAYGAVVSLVFNAASYGAFVMPPLALAVTMPAALVLAYVTIHASRPGQDTKQDRTRSRTRSRTQDSAQDRTSGQDTKQDTGQDIGQDTKQDRRPAVVSWDMGRATELIRTGNMSDPAIARDIFGPDATDADRVRVRRLRTSLNGSVLG